MQKIKMIFFSSIYSYGTVDKICFWSGRGYVVTSERGERLKVRVGINAKNNDGRSGKRLLLATALVS